jgi:ferredoxin
MRVRVDPSRCQGYGMCVEHAPTEFTYDDWGFAQSSDLDIAPAAVEAVDRAIAACPARAIRRLEGAPWSI